MLVYVYLCYQDILLDQFMLQDICREIYLAKYLMLWEIINIRLHIFAER